MHDLNYEYSTKHTSPKNRSRGVCVCVCVLTSVLFYVMFCFILFCIKIPYKQSQPYLGSNHGLYKDLPKDYVTQAKPWAQKSMGNLWNFVRWSLLYMICTLVTDLETQLMDNNLHIYGYVYFCFITLMGSISRKADYLSQWHSVLSSTLHILGT